MDSFKNRVYLAEYSSQVGNFGKGHYYQLQSRGDNASGSVRPFVCSSVWVFATYVVHHLVCLSNQ